MFHASFLVGNMQRHTLTVRSLLEHAERHHADAEIVSRRIEGDHQEFVNLARALLHASDHEMGATLQAVKAATEQQFVDEDQWIQESGFPREGLNKSLIPSGSRQCIFISPADGLAPARCRTNQLLPGE